jgi:hypothetical protein
MWIDAPGDGATVRQPFVVTGWALDLAATANNGMDLVHVWAYPASGAPPVFAGWAPVNFARPDVGAAFGALHTASGYGLFVRGLQPGAYTLVVYAHSTLVAGFPVAQSRRVQIAESAMVVMDAPSPGAALGQGFMVGGWAADFGAASGGGIDIVHVYAYPLDRTGTPIMLGAASVNVPRPDVGAYFGAQFSTTGYNLTAAPLPAGAYRVVAFGRSLVTGTFSAVAVADVTVR